MSEPPRRLADPRVLAAQVVVRVLRDGAYASAALDAELQRFPQLSVKARAFTTELTYSTLRFQPVLRRRLASLAPRGLPKDLVVESHLLVCATQLLLLDRTPPAQAVDTAVAELRALRGARVAGFANAVLRRMAKSASHFDREQAIRSSCPGWLLDQLHKAVGAEQTDALLGVPAARSGVHRPGVCVRLVRGRPVPEWLVDAERGRFSPLARRVAHPGDLRELPGWQEGCFVVQEEGAQLVALAVNAQPGECVLDACAGRGNKTFVLAEQVGPAGRVVATDIHEHKLNSLREEARRLGMAEVETALRDWTQGHAGLPFEFDRVLLDAPCTGTGTLMRRPEILLRLAPEDPARMGSISRCMLTQLASILRPGAHVLFAVCSVLVEECEEVIGGASDLFEPVPFEEPSIRAALGTGEASGRLLPLSHGTDGYFLANLRRR